MPQVLVSSNEWPRFRKYLKEDGFSTSLPFDFMLLTNSGAIVAERKKVPGDLLASAADGRLSAECMAMRREAGYCILVCEGLIKFTPDGHVADEHYSHWTRTGVHNLLRSVRYVEGVDVEYTQNIPDTAQVLRDLQKYFDDPRHGSHRVRSSLNSNWPVSTYEERYLHWLQGLPGISLTRATRIASVFQGPVEVVSASVKDWLTVPGIGDKTARTIYGFLHGRLDKVE